MQNPSVAVGHFFFRNRDWAFPILIAAAFAIAIPPSETFGSRTAEDAKDVLAVIVAVAGLALRGLVIGQRYIARSGEKKTIQADALFTSGVFSLCRNPLYTGNVMIVSGIFLMHGNIVVIGLGTGVFALIYRSIIAAEEDYLHRIFGPAYAAYCARVPRWLPDLTRLPAVMRAQPFKISRVFIVEYTNIGVTVIGLALAELYEKLSEPAGQANGPERAALIATIGVALVWVTVMRILKKRRILVS